MNRATPSRMVRASRHTASPHSLGAYRAVSRPRTTSLCAGQAEDDPFAGMTVCPSCRRAVGTSERHRCPQKGDPTICPRCGHKTWDDCQRYPVGGPCGCPDHGQDKRETEGTE